MPREPKFEGGRMIHIRIPEDLHKLLRVRVAEEDTTMQDWVTAVLEQELRPGKQK